MKRKMSRRLPALSLSIAASLSLSAAAPASDTGFAPLMNSLNRFHGDKVTWSFESGVLTGKASGKESLGGRVFTVERFGNFVLRFKARAGSGIGTVLLRSAVHPINFLAGYKIRLTPKNAGVTFLDLPDFAKMAEAPAKGTPYETETSLVRWETPAVADGEWVEYELACLGDRLTIKRKGATVVHYRHPGGIAEGSIGFQIEGPREAQFKDLQLRPLGKVHWPTSPPAGDLKEQSVDEWKAENPPFERLTEDTWARETKQLREMARNPQGFRPLFQGDASDQWRESNSFWSVKDGEISGTSANNSF